MPTRMTNINRAKQETVEVVCVGMLTPAEVYVVENIPDWNTGAKWNYRADFISDDALVREFEQIGMDDCHTDLTIRGLPVLRGLVGPMADGKHVRYETPEVFEELTKQWAINSSSQSDESEALEPAKTH